MGSVRTVGVNARNAVISAFGEKKPMFYRECNPTAFGKAE